LAELRGRAASTVISLGNSAALSILGETGVTKLRVGPGRSSKYLPGVRIIPTIHPAAALRQADQFPFIVTDIGKVKAQQHVWNSPDYIVADTEVDALSLLKQIWQRTGAEQSADRADILVIDIEVDVEKDLAFEHPNQYGLLCVGIGYAPGKVLVLGEGAVQSKAVLDRLGKLLRSRRIVAQNGKFDLAGLYRHCGSLTLWFDTMLASYVFDERPGIHGLKVQAVEYLGAPQYDNEIKQYVGPGIGYGAIPRPKLYKYNATDVSATYDMYLLWRARFDSHSDGENLRKVHDFLVAASNELMFVELNGIAIDREYLEVLNDKYIESLDSIEAEMDKIIGDQTYDKRGGINPRSPLQVKNYLKDHNVLVDSTNEETLTLLIEKHSETIGTEVLEFCQILLKHRKEAKLYGTYVKGIRKRLYRGRVYPTFLLHGTTTGRLSCRNPNLQNIPRGDAIRTMFVPSRPEHVFLQTDYAQAELRVLTFLARDSYFRGIFNAGERDLFDELTPLLYPGSDKATMGAAAWKELRIRIKAYVYGLSYGREAYSVAMEYDIPVAEAKRGMTAFFQVIPDIVAFREQTRKSVLAGQDLVTPWGRHRRYMLITKENVKDVMNEALAFLPQSTASDMCVMAMANVRQDLKGIGWVRNIVHDSILAECHPDNVEEVQAIMERRMIESAEHIVGDYVKFAVETKVGKNWGEV
jgi:DNA polymerase-1